MTAIYVIVGLAAVLLVVVSLNRNRSYHGYMMKQCNAEEDEYDRIYMRSQL